MSIYGSSIKRETRRICESNFRKELEKLVKETEAIIVFSANTMHELAKKGWCRNYWTRIEGNGLWVETTDGIMLSQKISYLVYPEDIFSDIIGVESILMTVFDSHGVAVYHKPTHPKKTIELVYEG